MNESLPPKALMAMIAVEALPGSPRYQGSTQAIIDQALSDLEYYKQVEVDAVILENSHDLPYIKPPLPDEAIQLMLELATHVRANFTKPIGIQMLEAANETALDIAHRANLNFLRVESYVFAHIGGAGLIEGCAGKLLRQRKTLNCEHIQIFGDIKKKHCSHGITRDLDIVDELKQAEFFLADGVIVTGAMTGAEPKTEELQRVKKHATIPVFIGSGMTPDNISTYYPHADGFIIGSTFRENHAFLGKLNPIHLQQFMDVWENLS